MNVIALTPVEAVKYQILVMFLIAGGTGFGTLVAVSLAARRLFDARQRLRLDRLGPPQDWRRVFAPGLVPNSPEFEGIEAAVVDLLPVTDARGKPSS